MRPSTSASTKRTHILTLATAVLISSCGGGGDSSSATAEVPAQTSLITLGPTTTSEPPTTTVGAQPEQEYIVEDGDLPVTIASKFNVHLDDLMALNGWVLEGQFVTNFPPIGTPIRIPAGGTPPGETVALTTLVATSSPETTVADACAPGEYIIEAGDFPIGVAEKFDTTLDALESVNADNPRYRSFAVGTVIKIPAKTTDC